MILQGREYNALTIERMEVHFLMKVITRKRVRTVQADDADEFDRKFNAVSDELTEDAKLQWDTAPMCVHFIYEEQEKVPETVADEFELQGIKYYCKDCPNMIKGKSKRERSHGCKYAEYGTVKDFTPACEWLYKMIVQGKVIPEED
jgi:hypothetical protein